MNATRRIKHINRWDKLALDAIKADNWVVDKLARATFHTPICFVQWDEVDSFAFAHLYFASSTALLEEAGVFIAAHSYLLKSTRQAMLSYAILAHSWAKKNLYFEDCAFDILAAILNDIELWREYYFAVGNLIRLAQGVPQDLAEYFEFDAQEAMTLPLDRIAVVVKSILKASVSHRVNYQADLVMATLRDIDPENNSFVV